MSFKTEAVERLLRAFGRGRKTPAPSASSLYDDVLSTTTQGAGRLNVPPAATDAIQTAAGRTGAGSRFVQGLRTPATRTDPRFDLAGSAGRFVRNHPIVSGAMGLGLAGGGYKAYQNRGQEYLQRQALAALGDLEGGPQRMEQEVLDEYMRPFRQGFTPDTEWEAEVRRQAAQQQSMLGGYGDRAGSAISGAYQDVANRGAADAAALQALAEQTGLTIGQLAEAGAGDVEGMLYGGDMDVSGTSGLTPLPSYLADSPDQMRAIGDAAAESALRNLSLDARGFVDESNIMSQMGPAMAQQLQNEMALRQFDVGREAESLIRDDRRDRRRSAEDLERAALFNWAEMQSQQRAAEIQDRARKEQAVRQLAVSNPKLIQTLYRKWNEGDQAVWEAQGFDFFDYVVSSARI